MKVIGVDVGGTKIKAGLVEGKQVKKKIEMATGVGRAQVLRNITTAIKSVYEKDIGGIGIGFAGTLRNGMVIKSPHIPLERFNLRDYVQKRFRKKVLVENDVTCATIAETKYGVGKKYKNVVMITIGTGVGGGIICEGKIYKGSGNAGEIGHSTINFDGVKSMCCNNRGCFEEYVSARGLQRTYGKMKNPKEIAKMAEEGDAKAKEAYKELGRNLGVGIVNIANFLDPEIIIVGGGIARSWKLFEKDMKRTIAETEFLKTKVVKAKLEDSGVIGAASLFDK